MNTTFLSIQQNSDSQWNIVKKKFPERNENSLVMAVSTKILKGSFEDKKSAETAAKKKADQKNLKYVPCKKSVITIAPFAGCFLPIELTPTGNVIGQGVNSPHLQNAFNQAQSVAEARNLPYIPPEY